MLCYPVREVMLWQWIGNPDRLMSHQVVSCSSSTTEALITLHTPMFWWKMPVLGSLIMMVPLKEHILELLFLSSTMSVAYFGQNTRGYSTADTLSTIFFITSFSVQCTPFKSSVGALCYKFPSCTKMQHEVSLLLKAKMERAGKSALQKLIFQEGLKKNDNKLFDLKRQKPHLGVHMLRFIVAAVQSSSSCMCSNIYIHTYT